MVSGYLHLEEFLSAKSCSRPYSTKKKENKGREQDSFIYVFIVGILLPNGGVRKIES